MQINDNDWYYAPTKTEARTISLQSLQQLKTIQYVELTQDCIDRIAEAVAKKLGKGDES